VIRQLVSDKKYLALSIVAPMLIIFFFKLFSDGIVGTTPSFVVTRYAVPIAAFIVHFLCFILCAIALVQERKAGTLERLFISGAERISIIGGYTLGYIGLATAQSFIVLTETSLLFELDLSFNELSLVFFVIWMLAIVSVLLGIFISTFARTEGHVFPFIPLVILPSIFLSGLLIDTALLPEPVQFFSLILPLRYANNIITGIVYDDTTNSAMAMNFLYLMIYAFLLWLLAASTLKETD
jgi:ABC-2 type transport system permease protein